MIRDSLQDDLFAVISNDAIRAVTRRASKSPLNNRNIKLVRCFKGGYNAQQETPIMIALEEFTAKGLITVETLHCERVKKDQMTEKQVVDWLLGSDIHLNLLFRKLISESYSHIYYKLINQLFRIASLIF